MVRSYSRWPGYMSDKIKTYARPLWLYRYRSLGLGLLGDTPKGREKFDREMNAILASQVYCGKYKSLNDPMEGFFRPSTRASGHADYRDLIRNLRSEKLALGIGSFSESWDNPIMWAHYADSFQGMCVCYSTSLLLEDLPEQHDMSRVAYWDKPYYLNLPGLKNTDDRARTVLSAKHLSWSYEREWRLFAPTPGLVQHKPGAIKSIYLGSRVTAKARQEIERRLEPTGITLHRIKTDGYFLAKKSKVAVRSLRPDSSSDYIEIVPR